MTLEHHELLAQRQILQTTGSYGKRKSDETALSFAKMLYGIRFNNLQKPQPLSLLGQLDPVVSLEKFQLAQSENEKKLRCRR